MLSAILFAGVILQHVSCQWSTIYTDGPESPKDQPTWLQQLISDRTNTLQQIDFKGGVFDNPKMKWTQTSYIQPQMHPYDRYFYDPVSQSYTVQKYLADLKERYGGIDALLLWPTYTNIGIDDRNQFDYFRSMPGGLDAIKNFTAELKEKGVRVLWPYNPWDSGTRREPVSDEDTFAKLLKETDGDGINGDTMTFLPETFWKSATKVNHPIALEAEDGATDEALNWSTMGWGYWSYPQTPVVDRMKFITKGKFMTNVCDRWAKSKTDNLQMAWFNGDGYESWENVWGVWNGITPRDAEALRRVGTMLRFFGKEGYLQSPDWEPHTQEVLQAYGSRWPLKEKNATMWTIVNRAGFYPQNLTGRQMSIGHADKETKHFYYDCYAGKELVPQNGSDPLPVPDGFNIFRGANAWQGFGGLEIDHYAAGRMSVPECTALCEGDAACSCVAYDEDTRECWRRADCQPANFQYHTDFTVYLKKSGFTEFPNRKCASGLGCVDVDTAETVTKGLNIQQCQAHCTMDSSCQCATFNVTGGACWKHTSCKQESFAVAEGTIILMNEARRPAAPIPATPMELHFPLEANGYGCVLDLPSKAEGNVATFLSTMQKMTEQPLYSFNATWKFLKQKMVDIPKTKPQHTAPPGMVKIKGGTFFFAVQGVEIEGTDEDGVDVQFPWEDHPQQSHQKEMKLDAFFIDKFPVTNAQYSKYLQGTKYQPKDSYNWLKNWNGSTEPPASIAKQPVTYVGLEEARAYCRWANGGSRLPHTWEWQYAAQGTDGRAFPWGAMPKQTHYPVKQNANIYPGPEDVDKYSPGADSPFGVADLFGNVWQYTDEFQDAHTRSVLLRGGSNYYPIGSSWYFPQANDLTQHGKYFIMDDRYERAGTVGFRCVVDAVGQSPDLLI